MHISRIRVPEFRVLKDIDISFEKEFVPRIFPLGSQNGGGKSTLLQLIFVLLHCSTDPEKIPYLQNMLQGFKISEGSDKKLLASFEIWDGEKTIQLDFFTYKDSSLQKQFISSFLSTEMNYDTSSLSFSMSTKVDKLNKNIAKAEKNINNLEKILNRLKLIKTIENEREREIRLRQQIREARSIITTKFLSDFPLGITSFVTVEELQKVVQENLEIFKFKLETDYKDRATIEPILQKISEYFQSQKLMYLCQYSGEQNKYEEVLVCHFSNLAPSKIKSFLETLSKKIFLAAPASQVFLFLSNTARKLLFKETQINNNYTSEVQQAKSKLSGFFTYDFVAVSLLTESFKSARDQDFAKAIETDGQYGNSYQTLVNDIYLILGNKKARPNPNLSEIIFKPDNNDNIELSPEDLSHGELKRLSIYIWLKYHNIEDGIVLMDEIEIAFHPDWQYQIISDIQEWAPNNQYILATHSYELCQALTPSHVKEIEPKLLKQNVIN